ISPVITSSISPFDTSQLFGYPLKFVFSIWIISLRSGTRIIAAFALRVVLALRMPLQLVAVEVHFAQVAGAVPAGLIVEVRRSRVAALAARGNCPRAHLRTEFDHCHEAVTAGAESGDPRSPHFNDQ